jgi:hypothetical protein
MELISNETLVKIEEVNVPYTSLFYVIMTSNRKP